MKYGFFLPRRGLGELILCTVLPMHTPKYTDKCQKLGYIGIYSAFEQAGVLNL